MRVRIIQFFIVIGLLLAIETTAYFSLPVENRTRSFFINFNLFRLQGDYVGLNGLGFDEIDPLLGWSRTDLSLQQKGYTVEHNCILLKGTPRNGAKPIKIFITGGSTTDIALWTENWPVHLHKILEQRGICADLYVGGVGGYSSGQELLKLLEDGIEINPDIHIAYSGANEAYSDYVSSYEYSLFQNILNHSNSGIFLPNTLYVIRNFMQINARDLVLKPHVDEDTTKSFSFWKKNMVTMNGIATANNYRFLGILQPVLGIGPHQQPLEMKNYSQQIAAYKAWYPKGIDFADSHSGYLCNMTAAFDSIEDKTYVDDCHLNNKYQPLIAKKIFDELLQRKLLNAPSD